MGVVERKPGNIIDIFRGPGGFAERIGSGWFGTRLYDMMLGSKGRIIYAARRKTTGPATPSLDAPS